MTIKAPASPEVYFHAGLGKVASTYLQKSVFPALENIHYIPRNRFRGHRRVIARRQHARYLLSREAGKYLERRLKDVAAIYPDARVLLFFRRQDEWIASHYRRYVKNGGTRELSGYLDILSDNGIWKRDQLLYMGLIEQVELIFGTPPFVLTYDRLKTDSSDFILKIAEFLGANINQNKLSTAPVHQSYSDTRLKVMRRMCRKLGLADPEYDSAHRHAHRLQRRLALYRNYILLACAGLVPENTVANEELSPIQYLDEIRQYYASDWQNLCEFEARQFIDRQ